MLRGTPTKYGTGIQLSGDFLDLNELYEIIHHIAQTSIEESPVNDILMSFAYDVRKTFMGMRDQIVVGEDKMDQVTYKACNILWPDFILYVNILRSRAAYINTTLKMQSFLYLLESIAIDALNEYNPVYGGMLKDWILIYDVQNNPYLELMLEEVNFRQLSERNGLSRFKALVKNMNCLLEHSTEYESHLFYLQMQAKKLNCDILKLKYTDETWDNLKYKW